MTGSRSSPKLALLHTAASNIALFDAEPSRLRLAHEVRPELLAAAEAGDLAPALAATADALVALSADADAVVLTCSTLGPAVVEARARTTVPVIRADAALARAAVSGGGTIVALCTAPTTLATTAALFADALAGSRSSVTTRLVEGAWALFRSGRIDEYLAAIATAATQALECGADRVALAQTSMAPAATLLARQPVIAIPSVALAEAAALARR